MSEDKTNHGPSQREDLVNLVAAPVLRQINQNTAAVMEMLGDLRESVDAVARQIKRQMPEND